MKPYLLHSIFPFLFSSRSHLGQRPQPLWAKKGVDPSSTFSVLGKRDQLFLTNPLVTLKGLLRSLRAVQTVSKRNGSILIINTNPSLSLLCERFAFFFALNDLGSKKANPRFAPSNPWFPSPSFPWFPQEGNQENQPLQSTRPVSNTNQGCFSPIEIPATGAKQNQPSRWKKGQNSQGVLSNSVSRKGKVFFCYEKWTGGLLSNWGKVFNSVETFDRFSNAFGPFLRENKIQFSTYREMRKRYNGLLGFPLRKLQEESLFLGRAKQSLPNLQEAPKAKRGSNENSLLTGKNQKPDLIFLINCNENAHVLQEAASLKIPVIGITNTSTNQTGITYPIPGNSESASFVFFCLKWVTAVSTNPSVFSL